MSKKKFKKNLESISSDLEAQWEHYRDQVLKLQAKQQLIEDILWQIDSRFYENK